MSIKNHVALFKATGVEQATMASVNSVRDACMDCTSRSIFPQSENDLVVSNGCCEGLTSIKNDANNSVA